MIKFSRTSWLTGVVLAAAITQPAGAALINDNYIGETPGISDTSVYYRVDRIGTIVPFEIYSMDASITGSTLTVRINTNYAGNVGAVGTEYGDLFLSSSWNPVGTAEDGYNTDSSTNSNSTLWEYGVAIDGSPTNATLSGSTTLYELKGTSNDANGIMSQDLTSGTFRRDQLVQVDDSTGNLFDATTNTAGNVVDTGIDGGWSISNGNWIEFDINLAGTNLFGNGPIAIRWAMSCANDVIEGVPAPIILLLMATGLFGVGVSTAVKRKRA